MSRRTTVLLVSLISLIAASVFAGGCDRATPTLSSEGGKATAPQEVDAATPAPTMPTAESETTLTGEAVIEPAETPVLSPGPALLAPPDEMVGTAIDLVWAWEQELGEDEWFELQIWPDDPETEPEAYDWYKEKQERITSATLSPGGYFWQVLVVQGREEERGEVMDLDYVKPPRFTLVRPSLRRGEPGVAPAATDTPTLQSVYPTETPRGPTPTLTDTPVQPMPTDTPQPTSTDTPIPPTDTPEPPAYPGTATPANGDYPYP
ncbi:MAG: hypothetical protein ACLFV5_00460 [Anaerolineales bacterium]